MAFQPMRFVVLAMCVAAVFAVSFGPFIVVSPNGPALWVVLPWQR